MTIRHVLGVRACVPHGGGAEASSRDETRNEEVTGDATVGEEDDDFGWTIQHSGKGGQLLDDTHGFMDGFDEVC